jgi:hypothetical protein
VVEPAGLEPATFWVRFRRGALPCLAIGCPRPTMRLPRPGASPSVAVAGHGYLTKTAHKIVGRLAGLPEEVADAFGHEGWVDMVMLIGLYLTTCAIINAFEVPAPEEI